MTATFNQQAVFDFLSNPAAHRGAVQPRRIDTHGAAVFLAGPDVYKVKRAVAYPYMDFSSLAKRKTACESEIAINRPHAPEIYIGTLPITRDANGLHLGGEGEIVEWAVHMRRFDENATLDRLADRGTLDAALIDRLAEIISEAHGLAPPRLGAAAVEALGAVVRETLAELAARPEIFGGETLSGLCAGLTSAFDKNKPLLVHRALTGKVRRCHGDLHLRNIVLLKGKPVLFDAIEFDESIATIDILYDLAFLVMDLWERDLPAQACRVLNHYLWLAEDEAGEIEGLALLPLFLALRAGIRAKVLIAQAALTEDPRPVYAKARRYGALASRFLAPAQARLIAIGGLSGTGKSTIAEALSSRLGRAPGALHLRSDIERKKMFGVPPETRLGPQAYAPQVSDAIYRRLGDLAWRGLAAGRAVIVDAAFLKQEERAAIARLAAETNTPFAGLWLEAPISTLKARVRERRNDASDATEQVVTAQTDWVTGPLDWRRLDASGPAEAVAAAALAELGTAT
jgi:uncharacterized protein